MFQFIAAAASNFNSTVHAIYMSYRSVQHVLQLWDAPDVVKMASPSDASHPWYAAANECWNTNHAFAGYLAVDLLEVLMNFPHAGGLDALAHHVLFIISVCSAESFRLMPFAFGWLGL